MTKLEILARLRSAPLLSGVFNCHNIGLTSVVLDERKDGSLSRIFFATETCTLDRIFKPDGHMTVGAHNHDKGIKFTTLFGNPRHVSLYVNYSFDFPEMRWYRYPFVSALDSGEFGLLSPRSFLVKVTIHDLDNTYMGTDQIHTVTCNPFSAWHCDESSKEDVKKHVWSPRPDLTLDSTNLYIPMSEVELEVTRQLLIQNSER